LSLILFDRALVIRLAAVDDTSGTQLFHLHHACSRHSTFGWSSLLSDWLGPWRGSIARFCSDSGDVDSTLVS
jgi:hypothetical protein